MRDLDFVHFFVEWVFFSIYIFKAKYSDDCDRQINK